MRRIIIFLVLARCRGHGPSYNSMSSHIAYEEAEKMTQSAGRAISSPESWSVTKDGQLRVSDCSASSEGDNCYDQHGSLATPPSNIGLQHGISPPSWHDAYFTEPRSDSGHGRQHTTKAPKATRIVASRGQKADIIGKLQLHASHLVARIQANHKSAQCQMTSTMKSLSYRIGTRGRNLHSSFAGKRQDLLTTTQLVGGAEARTNSDMKDVSASTEESGSQKRPISGAFFGGLNNVRRKSQSLSKTIAQNNGAVISRVKNGMVAMQKGSAKVAPSLFTVLSVIYSSDKGISFLSLYAMSLLGASCGFYLFLYFITTGYALGIGLPLLAAFYVYNKHYSLPRATFLHSAITLVWSARTLSFFVWREYFSWPALHEKVVEIQTRMSIPFASRLLCWVVYSFFYMSMMTMNWSRLRQGTAAKWGALGIAGLVMQSFGLGLETIADLQKNGFKSRHRHAWCNVGVWKWSTHPNYLGEGLFWWGTFLGHGFNSIPHSMLSAIGLGFIMFVLKGSTRSLASKHLEKYGDQAEFFEFQRTHSIWGPKRWWWWLHGMEELSSPQAATIVAYNHDLNSTNTSAIEEAAVSPTVNS